MNAHLYMYMIVTPKCPITLSNLPVLHVLRFQIVHNYWYGLVHIALLTSLFAMCHHNCYNRNSKPWAQPKHRPEFTIHKLTSDIWRYSHGRCRERKPEFEAWMVMPPQPFFLAITWPPSSPRRNWYLMLPSRMPCCWKYVILLIFEHRVVISSLLNFRD